MSTVAECFGKKTPRYVGVEVWSGAFPHHELFIIRLASMFRILVLVIGTYTEAANTAARPLGIPMDSDSTLPYGRPFF